MTPPLAPFRPFPKPSFGTRVVASLVDLVVAFGVMLLGLALVAMVVASHGTASWMLGGAAAVGTVLGALWGLWYTHVKDGMPGGQSHGKRLVGLMVVHLPTGVPCSRWQSAVRKLVWAGTAAVPFVGPFIEPFSALFDAHGRRLGDRAADTQVIRVADYTSRLAAPEVYAALPDAAMVEAMREVEEIVQRVR